VLELLGQGVDVMVGEQRDQVGGLGRVTPDELNGVSSLEDAGHFIARHENRNAPLGARHPLGQLPLGMGIGSIHFI
jgi:hypothetical protein